MKENYPTDRTAGRTQAPADDESRRRAEARRRASPENYCATCGVRLLAGETTACKPCAEGQD